MPDKAKLAIVGCGAHSARVVLPSLREASNVELAAACDRDEAALASACRRFGVPAAYADMDRMLDEVEADGVLVIAIAEEIEQEEIGGAIDIDRKFEMEEAFINAHTLPFDLTIKGGKGSYEIFRIANKAAPKKKKPPK